MEHTPLHETKIHGMITFPYSVYRGSIPAWFSSFPLHWHDDFELIYCTAGQVQISLWGQAYTLRAKDMIVILPHAVHSIEQAGGESGEYFNIMFHPSLFMGSENDLCYEKYVMPFLTGKRSMDCFQPAGSPFNQAAAPCVLPLLAHREEAYSTRELFVKSNLYLLLYYIDQYSAPGGGAQQASYSRLKKALYCIQRSYDHQISVQQAAELCGFSQSHFMKLFKEFTGMSFNAYLIHYRLDLAAKQLSETDLRVIDIAENCGFHNQSYFTRAFQKKYRQSPLAYRASARKNGRSGGLAARKEAGHAEGSGSAKGGKETFLLFSKI